MRADVIVVGGGIVGLATARELLLRRPGLDVVVLEKEATPGTHQTGHNSGVLHAGIYYPPGSLKARLCRAGKESLERFASERGIPFERCGKVVVAVTVDELDRLERLRERADANGIPGLEVLGPAGLRDREPHAAGLRALWSPTTGIIDFGRVALAIADDIRQRGGRIELGAEVVAVTPRPGGVVVATPGREHQAGGVITCAGVHADRFGTADRIGADGTDGSGRGERIIPFRGDYCTLTPDARPLVRSLIYPVPDPGLPFLGVHLTRRIDGEVLAGPNAVLALARDGYRRRDVDLRQVAAIVGYRGFRRLARRHWRTGAGELWRDWSRRAFARQVQRYVPELRASQLAWGPSGVRAQAVDQAGQLVDDFRFGGTGRVLAVRNAPSPAATSALALAGVLASEIEERWLSSE